MTYVQQQNFEWNIEFQTLVDGYCIWTVTTSSTQKNNKKLTLKS